MNVIICTVILNFLCGFIVAQLSTGSPSTSPIWNTPTTSPLPISNSASLHPPPCITNDTEVVRINGQVSFTATFANCLSNVADPLLPPNYYNNQFNGIVVVNTSIQLNNLLRIDGVAGEATLDFYLRLVWRDDRLAVPNFWLLRALTTARMVSKLSTLRSCGLQMSDSTTLPTSITLSRQCASMHQM